MSVLGSSYRIMYLAMHQRSGLTDVKAAVFKPDGSTAGIYPLVEAPGLFRGCYYYDYLSSTEDREGEYFSKVVSPTEGVEDIVRFSLYKAAISEADRVLRPVNLTGTIVNTTITGVVREESDLWAHVSLAEIAGHMAQDIELSGSISDVEASGEITSNPTIID